MFGKFSRRSVVFLGLLVLAAGCSGQNFTLNESVEGTLKIDGKPLAGVVVQFLPEGDNIPSSRGTTDEQGHFTLTCENKGPGAVVGKHRVVVLQGRTDSGARAGDDPNGPGEATPGQPQSNLVIPEIYGLATRTPLIIEVSPDQHTYELKLTGGRRR
jgi:hypothetical protein